MKRFVFFLLLMAFTGSVAADTITLNSAETLSTPTSETLEWYIDRIDAKAKLLSIRYRWLDTDGEEIKLNSRQSWHRWIAQDRVDNPGTDAALCAEEGDPWDCCTGFSTGDCDETSTDFSDIFGFTMRSQDVGKKIGVGLRTLIWNKMKGDILTGGNDGTFQEN